MINQPSSCDLKGLAVKFIPEMIGREIEKATSSIYPLQNVFIRKVKILKTPKFDLGKLMEVSVFHSPCFDLFQNYGILIFFIMTVVLIPCLCLCLHRFMVITLRILV